MAVISTLAVNIIAKTAGFTRGIRGTRRTMMSFNSTIQSTRRLLVGLIAGTGVIRGFKSLIAVASEAQETMAKFNVVFRGNAKVTEEWAKSFGDSVGRARKDVQKWLAQLQDIFVPLGFTREAAAKLSKSLVQLGVDVASFNEKIDEATMQRFLSAITGAHRAVQILGIKISESRIKQKAWDLGIEKSFANLNDLEKAFLRYRIIIDDSKAAIGDAIRTQDSYANQLKRTKALATNLSQALGESLLPALVGVLKFTQGIINVFKNMSAETIRNILITGRLALSFGAFLVLVPKIVRAILIVVKGMKALAAGQALVIGLSGPQGIAILAVGLAAAAATIIVVNRQFDKMIDKMKELSGETGEFKSIGPQIKVTLDDIQSSLRQGASGGPVPVIKTIASLRKEIDKLRFSKDELVIRDLEQELGFDRFNVRGEQQFKLLQRLLNVRGLLEKFDLGKQIFEDVATPLEKYNEQLRTLNSLLRVGAINQRTFDRATQSARKALEESSAGRFAGPGDARIIREAFVSVSGLALGTQDPTLSKMDEQLMEQKQTNNILMAIRNEGGLS